MTRARRASAPLLLALTVALLLLAFRRMSSDLLIAWGSEEYGHGMMIPVIAVLMARHRLAETPQRPRPSWFGPVLMGMSGSFLVIAILAAFQTAAHYGFVLALLALTLAYLGVNAARMLLPALGYLLFAIPLPHLIHSGLSQELQLISSTLGVRLLEMLDMTVYQEGNVIDLGPYKLQVAEACNGLRYLFPLLSFGYLAAYMMRDRLWKRVFVLLSAIPITIGMNSLRIALIGVTVNLWGADMAEGFLHDFEGWAVFSLCALLLLGEAWWLMRAFAPGNGQFRFDIFSLDQRRLLKAPLRAAAPAWLCFAIAAVLSVIAMSGMVENRREVIPEHPPLAGFPARLGDWRAREQALTADVLAGLQLTDYWLADYRRETGAPVNLYIAYYATQRIGSSTHSPSNCIPGGGWQIAEKTRHSVTLPDGTAFPVSRLVIRKGGTGQLVYFWFSERGRIITETSYAKWYMLVDAIALRRSDGALIRIVTPLEQDEPESSADARLHDFLSVAQPQITRFIPARSLTSPTESTPHEHQP